MLHTVLHFICSHTRTGIARSSTRRACCPLARSSSGDDAKESKIPHGTVSMLGFSPASRSTGGERASEMGRAGTSHSRTRGLAAPDARPASSDLYCPRASAAPGRAAPLSAPAAASAPRRRPMMRSSAPRRRRRPPPRCGRLLYLQRSSTHGARSTRSPPHPAAKLKVAESRPARYPPQYRSGRS